MLEKESGIKAVHGILHISTEEWQAGRQTGVLESQDPWRVESFVATVDMQKRPSASLFIFLLRGRRDGRRETGPMRVFWQDSGRISSPWHIDSWISLLQQFCQIIFPSVPRMAGRDVPRQCVFQLCDGTFHHYIIGTWEKLCTKQGKSLSK